MTSSFILPDRPFFLIRHGETEANVAQRICGGGVDTRLTELGRSQAKHVAEAVHSLTPRPTRIIHSDMSRSRETATIINTKLNLPMHGDNALREHMFGEWEGEVWQTVLARVDAGDKPNGGECRVEFAARVQANLTRVLNDHPDDLLMIVAHGGTFHAIMRIYGMEANDWIQNCHLHHFEPANGNSAAKATSPMPWFISSYDVENGVLVKKPASICPNTAGTLRTPKKSQPPQSKP